MAKKPVLTDINNISSAGPTINENSRAIEEAFENTLSRDGSSPNQMEADLDLNGNDLINVKTLQVQDLTVSGEDATGVIERALAAVEEAEAARDLTESYRDEAVLHRGVMVDNASDLATLTSSLIEVGEYVRITSIHSTVQRVTSGGSISGDGITFDPVATDGSINVKLFGETVTGATLIAALATGHDVRIPERVDLTIAAADVPAFVAAWGRVLAMKPGTTVTLEGGDHAIAEQVELSNPYIRNLIVSGETNPQVDCTGVSATGSTQDFDVTYTLDDASNVAVGDYLQVLYAEGTGKPECAEGAWKVTAVAGNDVTVKNYANYTSWPTMTVTTARVNIHKTILRWPATQRGLAISTHGVHINDMCIAGSFDPRVDAFEDGPEDGIQVGTVADTPNTGSTESEQVNSGSLDCTRLSVVEWTCNGVQVVGGNFRAYLGAYCANGWRGLQAARSGSAIAKYSAAIGNYNGYEAEEGGTNTINNAVSCGNVGPGVYGIGQAEVKFGGGVSYNNGTSGIDARNGALVLADNAKLDGNAEYGIYNASSRVVFGSGSTSANNVYDDVFLTEGAFFNASGAGTIGVIDPNYDRGCVYINSSGLKMPIQAWQSFTPSIQGVTITTDSSTGEYCQIGNILYWKMTLDYSGLNTGDVSALVVLGFPVAMAGRQGGCDWNVRRSTGVSMAATDTYRPHYNTISDAVVVADNGGNLMTYNGGEIQASGQIYLSGWYEVA